MTALLVAAFAFTLAGDRLTKALVRARLPHGASVTLAPWLRLRRVINTHPRPGLGVLAGLAAGLLALDALTPLFREGLAQAGLGAALGGAAGNALDRRHGGVLDFVDVRVWPVFNLADAAIVGGAAAVLWALMR